MKIILLLLTFATGVAQATSLELVTKEWSQLKQLIPQVQLQNDAVFKAYDKQIDGLVFDIAELHPKDYNDFLLLSLKEYADAPNLRPLISEVWKVTRKFIANELDAQSPQLWSGAATGLVYYSTLLVMLRFPPRAIATKLDSFLASRIERPLPQADRGLENMSNAVNNALSRLGIRSARAQKWTLLAGGTALSDLQELLKLTSTYRLDPLPNFRLLQAALVCKMGYQVTEDGFNQTELEALKAQLEFLKTEFPALANIYTNDRLISDAQKQLPLKWMSSLSVALSCKQISIDYTTSVIETRLQDLRDKTP
jgi:hypothetical protein